MIGRVVAMLLWAALLGGCGSPGAAAPSRFGSARPQVAADPEMAALEQQMLALVNRDRQAAGLAPLQHDRRLADIARAHSWEMRTRQFFSHTSPTTGVLEDRMDLAGYHAWEMRENLAVAPDIQRAEQNLLDSPGHRANILAAGVTHLGVGVVRGDHHGGSRGLTITQVFARPAALDTPEQARAALWDELARRRRAAGLPALLTLPYLDKHCARGLDEMPDEMPQPAVAAFLKQLAQDMSDDAVQGIAGMSVIGQTVMTATELELPSEVTAATTTYVSVMTARGRDLRGRPRVKVLLILARANASGR